jgi:uncharacterized membrane protein
LRYGFSPPLAFLLALLGNLVPFFPLYYGLEKLRVLLSKTAPWSVRFLDRFIARAERKVSGNFARYGSWALALFICIPFPFTGLYTATAAAVALKIPVRQAFTGILVGLLSSGTIVALLTLSGRLVL